MLFESGRGLCNGTRKETRKAVLIYILVHDDFGRGVNGGVTSEDLRQTSQRVLFALNGGLTLPHT